MAHAYQIMDHAVWGEVMYHPDGQEKCIKRSVTAYSSILLGGLVAILSVMEHLIANSTQIQHREIRSSTFSNSKLSAMIGC